MNSAASTTGTMGTLADELERLGRLHEAGLLTAEEFAQSKARLIINGNSGDSAVFPRAVTAIFGDPEATPHHALSAESENSVVSAMSIMYVSGVSDSDTLNPHERPFTGMLSCHPRSASGRYGCFLSR